MQVAHTFQQETARILPFSMETMSTAMNSTPRAEESKLAPWRQNYVSLVILSFQSVSMHFALPVNESQISSPAY